MNYIFFKYLLNKKHIYIYIYSVGLFYLKRSKSGQFNLIRANQFQAFLLGSLSVIGPFIV